MYIDSEEGPKQISEAETKAIMGKWWEGSLIAHIRRTLENKFLFDMLFTDEKTKKKTRFIISRGPLEEAQKAWAAWYYADTEVEKGEAWAAWFYRPKENPS
jgi:hypothetical protein